ncbi:kinesin family protein, putative [Ichthyophthirius multifiliis]|uniref:Kinesin family protein, putative n=1 Tax=Ichthyophthirius multifiliis TaxID=5932 RepID=G0QIW0_ICHMU|nr:kinesin family protein, putative [Ichthyophthirius multifiliis]EGR34845.1 kinesin family protein, putative [Ichthyophthirius multifiliis]|eukprot:XP_004040149.1 kinesin family protein, putative [Ichthyophthirius multifiliis]
MTSQNSNFCVCVRIKPTTCPSFYTNGHQEDCKYISVGPQQSILLMQPNSTCGNKVFMYDRVFDSQTKTLQIFQEIVKPILNESLLNGFSQTILVYGMTGSGKTYTMFGNNFENKKEEEIAFEGGVVQESVRFIIEKSPENKIKAKMSYLEIYNEQIRDLLSQNEQSNNNLNILEDLQKGVYCPQLIEKDIHNLQEIQSYIFQGNKKRTMASTKMNEFSSRSHAIIQLQLEIEKDMSSNKGFKNYFSPKLYLVDLAGSEKAFENKGNRLKEGSNINKSLLSLGNCINILAEGNKKLHIPYRDSKLTRLLKESLGGNAKTLIIACITPAFKYIEETINTLKYAQRAKNIKKEVYENIKQIYEENIQVQQQQFLAEQQEINKKLFEQFLYLKEQEQENFELQNEKNKKQQEEEELEKKTKKNNQQKNKIIHMKKNNIINLIIRRIINRKWIFINKIKRINKHKIIQ